MRLTRYCSPLSRTALQTRPLALAQYFDTMRDIGSSGKATTVFVPHQPGSLGDISAQIRSGVLQGAAAGTSAI